MRSAAGFTLAELLVGMAIMLVVTGAVLALVDPARGMFQAQPEISDMHQRLRVAVDALAGDLLRAGAGVASTVAPPVLPYRIGALGSDPGAAVFYRPDVVSVVFVPWTDTAVISRTYYLQSDPGTGTPQLMRYDGAETDLPVVDHVVRLGFEYFDAGAAPIDPAALQDGPWVPGGAVLPPFDADLLRVRRVRATVRVEAALASMRGPAGSLFARGGTSTSSTRYVPDRELRFDVALRNMGAGR
ncbi:MAG: prepilin-type N-terminal cleavage/methylation domain-containing protein [Acidobacteria bacterium]|nr:prepilin-type N-terminal cleavage/methylation domain-containing protein [Acidobacteriota bacterium]